MSVADEGQDKRARLENTWRSKTPKKKGHLPVIRNSKELQRVVVALLVFFSVNHPNHVPKQCDLSSLWDGLWNACERRSVICSAWSPDLELNVYFLCSLKHYYRSWCAPKRSWPQHRYDWDWGFLREEFASFFTDQAPNPWNLFRF